MVATTTATVTTCPSSLHVQGDPQQEKYDRIVALLEERLRIRRERKNKLLYNSAINPPESVLGKSEKFHAKPIRLPMIMVQAVLKGNKVETRQAIKRQKAGTKEQSYQIGDVLYIQEPWFEKKEPSDTSASPSTLFYQASHGHVTNIRWKAASDMPKRAARLFLRVTDIHTEYLQKITCEQIQKEGIAFPLGWSVTQTRKEFARVWNKTICPKDRALYGWDANPQVWVVGFSLIGASS